MITIALCEDDPDQVVITQKYCDRYASEHKVQIKLEYFSNAMDFLASYKPYDIVLMDIELPYLDGMEAARKLRMRDSKTVLIFITNMAQYAIKGYEVEALDFVLKPIMYGHFERKITRALNVVQSRSAFNEVSISTGTGIVRIPASEIIYVEVANHRLVYHTRDNEYSVFGSLSEVEKLLTPPGFIRCNSCYLVNLDYVKSVEKYVVKVGDDDLVISHPRRKEFMKALTDYLGERR